MKNEKTSTITISAKNEWLRHVWITSENGNTCRRIESFVVFENGNEVCTFDGTDVHDEIMRRGRKPITFEAPIKWNTRAAGDLDASCSHMVKTSSPWGDAAYTLYIPAKFAQVEELNPVRSGYYMARNYRSAILGKCSHVYQFPGFKPYALHDKIEEAAKSYCYTGLDVAKPCGIAYLDDLISAIHEAREIASNIINLTDTEFFAAFSKEG